MGWRKPLGEVGTEESPVQSIDAARLGKAISPQGMQRLIVNTTVIKTAIR